MNNNLVEQRDIPVSFDLCKLDYALTYSIETPPYHKLRLFYCSQEIKFKFQHHLQDRGVAHEFSIALLL
jgi:hypothetical protein